MIISYKLDYLWMPINRHVLNCIKSTGPGREQEEEKNIYAGTIRRERNAKEFFSKSDQTTTGNLKHS